MILKELFSDIYSYEKTRDDADQVEYEFFAKGHPDDDDPDDPEYNKSLINVTFQLQDGVWLVGFYRDGDHDLTGAGDALKIFSTVLDVIKLHCRKHKVNYLGWSAKKSETSRVKLYNRLIKRVDGFVDVTKTPEKTKDETATNWLNSMLKNFKNDEWTLLARKNQVKSV